MKKLGIICALFAVLFSTFLTGCSEEEEPEMMMTAVDDPEDMDPEEMDPDDQDPDNEDPDDSGLASAPDFSLMSVDGGIVNLANFEGKPLVIFFFGSTCPLCIASAPSVESNITKAYETSDISIIGIDTWDGTGAAVTNFRNSTGVTFDLLLDGSGVQSDYSTTYDRLFVINGEGKIVHKGTTSASNDVGEVVKVINALL